MKSNHSLDGEIAVNWTFVDYRECTNRQIDFSNFMCKYVFYHVVCINIVPNSAISRVPMCHAGRMS